MNWILLAILVVGSLLLHSSRFSLGILYGGLISIVNFHWLYRNLLNVFTKHPSQARKAILVRYYIRLAVTGLVLYWIISGNLADVIGLVIGLSVVVLNIILTTVLALSKKYPIGEVR
ncbi:MAG: ATP synthase subunit I [Proteobacteria bacterium]|nr:ATP synthase subunit I [Pseudomonadota bacterium]MBU2027069.1 ATP synthase subunit I [Pseudomonadota bacterium]MBU4121228.1 ATP synthase subunit I [Pseudomonadota bacterium]